MVRRLGLDWTYGYSAVHITAMTNGDDRHGLSLVVDLVDHSVARETNSIEWSTDQFLTTHRTRMMGEPYNRVVDAPKN